MKCKICGITSYEDAIFAIESGADALGFVFYEKSPRYLSKKQAKAIIEKLPPFIEKVALFVNVDADTINITCKEVGATLAQIHFDADENLYKDLAVPYIKVIRAQSKNDIFKYTNEYRLIDSYTESYGGTGKDINLEWFDERADNSKIIIAGGLNPENVASLKKYGFYGVDVSSGVEKSRGIKDSKKIKDFIQNACK